MTTRPRSRYFSDHARMKASVRSQLMQVYVQKSTRTTFPARPSGVSGDELSQPVARSKPGRRPSTGNGAVRGWRRAPKRLTSRDLRLPDGARFPSGPPVRGPEGAPFEARPLSDQRSELNAARISVAKSSGSSQAAKWPPLSTSLKYARL